MNRFDHEHRPHRPYRNAENGLILGVCAGIADYFDAPRWLVRICTLAVGWIFPIPTIIAYVVAAVLMPEEPLHYRGHGDERSFWQSRRRRS